jgi:DNA-binding NtrC family response regulator
MANILVVDDEMGIRELLMEILNDEGHHVILAENASQARERRQQERPDLVLLDIWMPDTDGVSLLKEWASSGLLTMPVIMMSGHATVETAVEATKIGAYSFLEKPITLPKLLKAVEQGLNKSLTTSRVAQVRNTIKAELSLEAAMTASSQQNSMVQANGASSQSAAPAPASNAYSSFDFEKPLREARDNFEKAYFEFHLEKEGGSMTKVAEKTGLERTHLYRKLKQLGLDLGKGKKSS